MNDLIRQAKELEPEIIRWRRHIHQNPEVSAVLPNTCAYVTGELQKMGYQPYEVGGGVVAMLDGDPEGRTILLRADMDALPMAEDSGEPFASQNPQAAHTCGHDTHTAMLLGAAQLLMNNRDQVRGRVKLMFQPGEEGYKGALQMVNAGLLENPHVDAAFGMHSASAADFPTGSVMHTTGPMMVLAGPGSGKTAVITGRTCQLVTSGISASRILVVTFTRAAAKEMKERYLKAMGKTSTQVTFGTFHGVFYAILRHTYRMSGNNILSEEEKKRLMRELVNHYARDLEEEDLEENLAREISTVKNNQIPLEHYYSACMPQEKFREIYEAYEKWRKENKKLDFDDLMVQCKRLFLERPEVLRAWQQKFQYILIDEFQDISPVQYEIVRMLALPENNLFIVGDDDQSIYRFRGANIKNILSFEEAFPGAKVIKLEQNYRSTQNILNAANEVIRNNRGRKDKTLWTANGEGERVRLAQFDTAYEEADYIACDIKAESAKENRPFSDFAVLYRTNAQSAFWRRNDSHSIRTDCGRRQLLRKKRDQRLAVLSEDGR